MNESDSDVSENTDESDSDVSENTDESALFSDLDDDSETLSTVIYEIEEDESSNQQLDNDWSESSNSLHFLTFTEKPGLNVDSSVTLEKFHYENLDHN
ncbi:hypothetical protein NPIL_148811 [Nephila pilipes]|uniref:Uncharacterized protein n=1 Tax=Nephila pilipes TaxID=299642 RepID=A0A8X6PXD0_NEPPI|nr:hypothetical protein NPIL_148811 [Nephila pilipes]